MIKNYLKSIGSKTQNKLYLILLLSHKNGIKILEARAKSIPWLNR